MEYVTRTGMLGDGDWGFLPFKSDKEPFVGYMGITKDNQLGTEVAKDVPKPDPDLLDRYGRRVLPYRLGHLRTDSVHATVSQQIRPVPHRRPQPHVHQ